MGKKFNNKMVIEVDGRTYVLTATTDFQGAMICYSIREVVRPTWKIFRTCYCEGGSFWTGEYPTIEDGLRTMLGQYLFEEQVREGNRKKIEEFLNRGGFDKSTPM